MAKSSFPWPGVPVVASLTKPVPSRPQGGPLVGKVENFRNFSKVENRSEISVNEYMWQKYGGFAQ